MHLGLCLGTLRLAHYVIVPLTNATDLFERKALMSLFFEEMPTYLEIVNGTPKLRPIFRLSEAFKGSNTQLVTSRGIEPRFDP